MITSKDNPKIKQILQLEQRKQRDEQGLFVVEGAQEIRMALQAGFGVQAAFICPDRVKTKDDFDLVALLNAQTLAPLEVAENIFGPLAYMQRSCALLVLRQHSLDLVELAQRKPRALLALVGIEKPGNLGALLRTAHASGFDAAVVADKHIDLWNPNCLRASRGSVLALPLAECDSSALIAWLKQRSYHIYATQVQGGTPDLRFDLPCALVLGSEKSGLGPEWSKADISAVSIPMAAGLDSLNVAVAGGILMYTLAPQLLHS